MRVYGMLEKAQLEVLAADIASPPNGFVYWNSASLRPKYYDSASWRTFFDTDSSQTFTNKTVGDSVTQTHIATPANPAAGFIKIYAKADNNFYKLTSGGVETAFASGSTADGMISNNASSASQTVLTGTSLFTPYLSITTAHTYTVQTGAQLVTVQSLIINGTGAVIVNGTGVSKIIN